MNEEVKGKKSPQLRFSGFKKIENEKLKDENWFYAPASEIFISVNDRNHPELPVLSASQELGMIYRDEGGMNIFHDVANEITYKRVKPGQFVIHLRSFQGGFAHSKVEGITSPAYTILDFKDRNKHNDLFWKYVLTSEEFIKRLELITYGIRDGRSINFSDFSTLKFHFPSYEVQQKIGAFLSHVDSLIQAKTKKLESLKAVKKSLLQKCFPKAGEKVPEMRFAGFSGDWEEKKLGEIGETKSGIGFPDKEQGGSEGIPFFKVSDMNSDGNEYELVVANNYVTEEQINRNNWNIVKNVPAVFFAKVGAAVMLNRKRLIRIPFLLDNNTMAYIFDKSIWDCDFGKHLFETIDLTKLTQVGALPSYNGSDVENLQIFLPPTLAEQQKIGQFFSKYDSLISLQQKEIDKLKDIKKSLLQKMFV